MDPSDREQRAYRRLTCRLFSGDQGQAWLALARRRWEVDLPRFRAREKDHDMALIRDGRAEPILEIAAYLERFGPTAGNDDSE